MYYVILSASVSIGICSLFYMSNLTETLRVSKNVLLKYYYHSAIKNDIVSCDKYSYIKYEYKGTTYKLMINKIKRGPNNILCIRDEEGNDITDIVKPFLGPDGFTRGDFEPEKLGFNKILISTLTNETIVL